MNSGDRPALKSVISRGWRKRCPHCARGSLFEKGVRLRDECLVCGIRFLRNQGDHWAFLLIVDRAIFILPLIVIIYLGLLPAGDWMKVVFFASVMGLFIATTGRRYGICVGLDYLSRYFWGDPDEVFPAIPEADGVMEQ